MLTPHQLRPICQAGKDTDPRWYRIHRRLSIHLTWLLLHTPARVNHVSWLMMLCGAAGAALCVPANLGWNALGWVVLYLAFLLDKVDGEMARYHGVSSVTGVLLDRLHHRLVEPLLFLAVGVHEFRASGSVWTLVAAFSAMLAANAIEEMQQLPPFIAFKHARGTGRWPATRGRRPSVAFERAASAMKSLKVFRTFITLLPLVAASYVAQAVWHVPAPTWLLVTAAVALGVYVPFQAAYYLRGRLEADIAEQERVWEATGPAPGGAPAEPRRESAAETAGHAVRPVAVLLLALGLVLPAAARAATYYVETGNPAASTSGPGTEAQPYSTITSALNARAAAGNTIVVKPGTYRETATIPASGVSGSPFVLQASGPGVVIDGADDFSSPSKWTKYSGNVYKASSVVWSPKGVYVDGARYTTSTAALTSIPVGSYEYQPGSGLFVNVGGGSPGQHQVLVGRRLYGIQINGRSWITVDGFAVTRTEDRGIYTLGTCTDLTITHNTVTMAKKYGLQVSETVRARIANNLTTDNDNHGIAVTTNVSAITIEDNESARNAIPGTRAANGLYLYGATNCVSQRNRFHDNQDTGEHIQQSTNILSLGNLSWNNGDHGFDHLFATSIRHLGDVAYGNFKDGFSIEGSSPNNTVQNCIAINNGLTTSEFDLWVDNASFVGLVSNDNVFWNSTSQQPVKIGATLYSTVAAYSAATGQDTRTVQADPRFVAPAAGNFHLQPGSSAIDNGNASVTDWPLVDIEGSTRRDDPATPNSGIGVPNFSDRGALEYQPAGLPPNAVLTSTPPVATAPATVTLNAGGSSDPEGSPLLYAFDFGDGSGTGPLTTPSVQHTYAAGSWTASVIVTDNTAMADTATVLVISNQPPVAALGVTPTSGRAPVTVTANAAASTDADGTVAAYSFDFGDGTGVGPQASPSATHVFGIGTWSVRATVTDDRGATSAPSAPVVVTVGAPNQPPTAALALSPGSGLAPLTVTANAAGSTDTDGSIVSYRFDFGDGTIVGPQPGSSASHTFAGGTWNVTVVVTDNDGGTAAASASITVSTPNQAPNGVIVAPASAVTIEAGQSVVFTASGSDPEGSLPLSWNWDFGGGATGSTQQNPGAVIFHNTGTYTVFLTVRDALGLADPTPDTRMITVVPANPNAANDEVHWTVLGQTSVAFDWRGPSNEIRYGLTSAYDQTVLGATPEPLPWSSPGPFWEARITGLQEDKTYHYSIGGGSDHTFRTPPPRGSSGFTIMATGDIGDAVTYPPVAGVQSLIAAQDPAFTLMMGDLTYANENGQAVVDQHFNDVMVWSQNAAYMPAWGNHEWESATDDFRNYKGRFALPNPRSSVGATGVNGGGEDWYWFDYGNVRFIAYPEPFPNAWQEWQPRATALMDSAQADPAIRFVVTFGHRPAYSSGHHPGEPRLKGILDTLGLTHPKYVLNLNGHSHNYERSFPQSGVIHVTAGTGGSTLEQDTTGTCIWAGGCPAPSWSAFRAYHRGALRLRFTSGGIEGEELCGPAGGGSRNGDDVSCIPGTIIDQFTIGAPTPDRAPVVSAPNVVEIAEDSTLALVVTADDPDFDPIQSFTADLSHLPAGNTATFVASEDRTTGTLLWRPAFADSGRYLVSFAAANVLAGSATTEIRVRNVDRAPLLTPAAASVSAREDSVVTLAFTASDPDGDAIGTLGMSFSPLPPGGAPALVPGPGNTSGSFTWTPTFTDSGHYAVTFTAGNALTGTTVVSLDVRNLDRAPVVTAPPSASTDAGTELTFDVQAGDIDGDAINALTADLSVLPAGNSATFTPAPDQRSGTFSWTPAETDTGSFTVWFRATNALEGAAVTAVHIGRHDHAPIATAPARVEALEAAPLTITITAADPDSNPVTQLSAILTALPAGHNAVFTAGPSFRSGTLTWTPTYADSGEWTVQWIAANALAETTTTVIHVGNVDRAPVVTAPASLSRPAGTAIQINVTASDADGDSITALTANLSVLPAGNTATFTPAPDQRSGTFLWTPAQSELGTFTLVFRAQGTLAGTASMQLTVTAPNVPPIAVLAVSPSTGNAPITVTANASGSSDPDGTIASYRFDFGDGTIVGPTSSSSATHAYAAGAFTARVFVTDSFGAVSSTTQSVTVAAVDPGTNFVTNFSFETNTTGWAGYSSATIARVSGGFDGAWALQMTAPAAGQSGFGVNDSPNWVVTTAGIGTRYRFGAWVRSAGSFGAVKFQIREYQNNTKIGNTVTSAGVSLSPSWQFVTADFVTQANGTTLDWQIFDQPLVAGEVFVADNLSIRVVTSAPPAMTAGAEPVAMSVPGVFRAAITPSIAHPDATLWLDLTRGGPVRVELFDAAGRRVRTILDGVSLPPGHHAVPLDGRGGDGQSLGQGLYFYRVQAPERAVTGRYVIIR